MPRDPAVGSVLAYTTIVSASGPLVIHIFEPLSTYRSPRRSARVRIDVRAGVGLGHRQCADMLARDQLRQITQLLLGTAVSPDLIDAKIGMRAVGKADRRRST